VSGGLPRRQWRIPIPLRLVFGLALLVLLGTGALMLPGMATRPLALNEAFFTAVSALSVTGLSIITPVRDLTFAGQIVLLLLIQIGGVGFMVLSVVVFQVLGRRVSLADRLALTDSFGLLAPGAILRLTRGVLLTVLAIEAAGAALLWLTWREQLGPERAVFYAVFHAVSAFCNAGFDLFGGLPEYPAGIPNDGPTLAILGGLIVLGGLGIPVLAELLLYWRDRRLSLHTRLTLWVVAFLVVLGAVGIFAAEGQPGAVLAEASDWRRAELALFQSISARTAGFGGIQPFEALSPASQLLMIALMFIGCAPASMGGGITTGTFVVLVLAVSSYARGLPQPEVSGRSLGVNTVRRAGAVLTVSLLVVLLATWLVLVTHDATLDQALFEVVSAFATCGLTLAFTSQLNLFGQVVVALTMFWGRLGALTLVAAFARQQHARRVSFPEEQLLLG
jgi:trk system potassium uptake protein